MSVFEIVEPSLAWPKSARIGFYGPRILRQPSPRRCPADATFLPKSLQNWLCFLMPFLVLSMTFLRPKWMPKSSQNRAQELSKTLLEPGCRPNLFSEAFFEVFGGSRNLKNHAPAIARAHFLLKSQFAAGAPKSSPKASQYRPRGFETLQNASQIVGSTLLQSNTSQPTYA